MFCIIVLGWVVIGGHSHPLEHDENKRSTDLLWPVLSLL